MSKTDTLNVSVTFRHTDATDAIKSYAIEKVSHCLERFIGEGQEGEAHVILSVEKLDHLAEIRLHSKRYDLVAKGVTGDLYSAVDKMIDHLDTQIRKQKEKQVVHKSGQV